MFSTTIIATIGRPTLERAVQSVIDQSFAKGESEIIVVNDSGVELAACAWSDSPRIRILNTMQRERSVARNTGAAVARGRFLHFLDDDDWMAPGALEAFWELAQANQAAWLYGTTQLVDRAGHSLIRLEHRLKGNCFSQVLAGEWIPLQASLISAESFFAVGGFNPLLAGPEDIDLLRRIALHGDIEGTAKVVAFVARGDLGSTTDRDRSLEMARWAREAILDHPKAFGRLRASSRTGFLRGRTTRAYATSLLWNLRQRSVGAAVSRGFYTFASILLSAASLPSREFWRALMGAYQSPTFERGFREAGHEKTPGMPASPEP